MKIKFEAEIETPIIVEPGFDPNVLGRYYSNLRFMRTNKAYLMLGEKVETTYTTGKTKEGLDEVRIIEKHYEK